MLADLFIDTAQMTGVRWYYQEHQLGTWKRGARTSHLRDVAGTEPDDSATPARRYAAAPGAQRTAGNLARVLWDPTRIALTPAPRLDRFVRQLHQPQPPAPERSARSATWAAEHLAAPRPAGLGQQLSRGARSGAPA